MGHGDIGLITFHWTETSRLPVANATTDECVDWQKLDGWTRKNSVNMFQLGPRASYAWPGISGRLVMAPLMSRIMIMVIIGLVCGRKEGLVGRVIR